MTGPGFGWLLQVTAGRKGRAQHRLFTPRVHFAAAHIALRISCNSPDQMVCLGGGQTESSTAASVLYLPHCLPFYMAPDLAHVHRAVCRLPACVVEQQCVLGESRSHKVGQQGLTEAFIIVVARSALARTGSC